MQDPTLQNNGNTPAQPGIGSVTTPAGFPPTNGINQVGMPSSAVGSSPSSAPGLTGITPPPTQSGANTVTPPAQPTVGSPFDMNPQQGAKFSGNSYPNDTFTKQPQDSSTKVSYEKAGILDKKGSDKTAVAEPRRETAKSGQPQVRKADIEKVVSNWTGIPITKLTEDEGAKLLNLEKRIHQRLIDQEEAVTAVAEAVRRGRIGLAAANRPIASFIFLGPSGTGKTELAKTLAEILFGRDDAMVRLDMSEYMEKHEVAKLIGAPPGYVGYEEGGQLTEAVRAKPYSIVLLDEVEKAHPDVFNILLQLLEDGRLTDNKGNTISFKNTIVICTSNIGSVLITQKLGEKDGKPQTEEQIDKDFVELTDVVSAELHKFFRPELLNRFDDIVIFKPLRREDMAAIAKLGIEKTGKLLKEQDIKISITDKAIQQLALEGYDPVYGARPLRRLIQTSIENPIAVLLITKTFVPGDTIIVGYDQAKGDYMFRKATPQDLAEEKKKENEEKNKKPDTSFLQADGKQQNGSVGNTNNTNPPKNNTPPSVPSKSGQPATVPSTPQQNGNSMPKSPTEGVGVGQPVSTSPQSPPLQKNPS